LKSEFLFEKGDWIVPGIHVSDLARQYYIPPKWGKCAFPLKIVPLNHKDEKHIDMLREMFTDPTILKYIPPGLDYAEYVREIMQNGQDFVNSVKWAIQVVQPENTRYVGTCSLHHMGIFERRVRCERGIQILQAFHRMGIGYTVGGVLAYVALTAGFDLLEMSCDRNNTASASNLTRQTGGPYQEDERLLHFRFDFRKPTEKNKKAFILPIPC